MNNIYNTLITGHVVDLFLNYVDTLNAIPNPILRLVIIAVICLLGSFLLIMLLLWRNPFEVISHPEILLRDRNGKKVKNNPLYMLILIAISVTIIWFFWTMQ